MKKTNRTAVSLILFFGGLAWMLFLVFIRPDLQMTVIPAIIASAIGLSSLPEEAFGEVIGNRGVALTLSLFLVLGSIVWMIYVSVVGGGNLPLQQTVLPGRSGGRCGRLSLPHREEEHLMVAPLRFARGAGVGHLLALVTVFSGERPSSPQACMQHCP